jgi:hypothetical protein
MDPAQHQHPLRRKQRSSHNDNAVSSAGCARNNDEMSQRNGPNKRTHTNTQVALSEVTKRKKKKFQSIISYVYCQISESPNLVYRT